MSKLHLIVLMVIIFIMGISLDYAVGSGELDEWIAHDYKQE